MRHYRGYTVKTKAFIVAVLLLAIVAGAAVAQGSYTHVLNLARGETVLVTCDGAARLRADRQNELIMALACGRPEQAQPTATPTKPAQPTAASTPMPSGDMIDMLWHPPMAHGDRPRHEHGDPPPAWLLDYLGASEVGEAILFQHRANTPGETMPYWKHTAFKGWETTFNGQACYGVFHLDFNPGGHASRFHSYQLWCRDNTGAVSAISGWMDFGTGGSTGPQVVETCGQDSGVRPIMLVSQAGCPVRFENWYARAAGSGEWAPDFGFNINPNFYAGGDVTNPSTWTPTGGIRNLERRIEFAWYLGQAGRNSPRGEFYATQWGDLVSGPTDPVCGTQRSYGERTYTVLCLRQVVAPTVQPMVFPGNSVQRTFTGDGVQLPN